jgi:hypothetical protein
MSRTAGCRNDRWLAAFLENHGLGQRGRCGAVFAIQLAGTYQWYLYGLRIMYRAEMILSLDSVYLHLMH